jgi:vitamin B12 transporter
MNRKIFSLALMAVTFAAHAQDTSKTKDLDPLTITANKVEQKQSTTGKVVTVITKEQLEKSSGKTVSQVLNEQAGIVINGAYNTPGSVQTVYMRGASPGRVLILMDGVPVNDPSFINSEYDMNFFSINEVERIEVCKGAQSTLYGSDAIAGVINIITINKDIKKPFNVKATAAYGSFNTFKDNVQLFGKKDKFTYNVRYARLSTDGFSSAYDSSAKSGFDKDAYQGNVASASVQYQLAKQVSVRAFSQYSNYKADIDASIFMDERDYFIDNSVYTSGAGFNYKGEKFTITVNYQYSDLERTYLNDSGYIPAGAFGKYERNAYKGRTQFAELFTSIHLGSGFTLLQGGDYRYGLMNNDYLSISSFGPYASTFKDTSVSQASLYASLMFSSNDKRFNAELGGRLNVHSRYGSNHTYTFNPSYKISEHYRVFGSIASGFKAPSIYQVYDKSVGNRELKPEQSVNYEIGVSQEYKKIRNRMVYFYRTIKDGVDFNYVTYKYFNFVKQIVRGLEYELSFSPTGKLNITANYTFLSARETTQSRENFHDTVYTYLLRRPKHNINFTAGYQFSKALFGSVGAKYISGRNDVGGYMAKDVELDSYFFVNAYAEYKLKQHFKFFVDLQNLTDKKFFDIRGYNAMPFMATGGITFSW